MRPEHRHELDQFSNLFKNENLGHFEEHQSVFEAFLQTENHVTINELKSILENRGKTISSELITETMILLVKYGFATESEFDNNASRFEHRHPGHHHDHMICTQCSKIIEFENDHLEKLQKMIAQTYGFHMLSHRMEIYGLCSECTMVQAQKECLACAKPGAKLVISGIDGGRNVNMRLRTMGLKPGDNVEVVNSFGGQIVIAVDYTRLILGKGLANKMKVQNVSEL